MNSPLIHFRFAPVALLCLLSISQLAQAMVLLDDTPLKVEKIKGAGLWVSHPDACESESQVRVTVKVWFEEQFLGDGQAYQRRSKEFSNAKRTVLRDQVVKTLKKLSDDSYASSRESIDRLIENGTIKDFNRHWIVNGFSCSIVPNQIMRLSEINGVRCVFVLGPNRETKPGENQNAFPKVDVDTNEKFVPTRYQHPWYANALKADQVWEEYGISGQGTLNVIHDFNFVEAPQLAASVYRNPNEIADNQIDDDGNGLIDDIHGFNFQRNSNQLTTHQNAQSGRELHGNSCASIICGRGTSNNSLELGVAPSAQWAGVIAGADIEKAIEWAIEQKADTYSMSFSRPGLGEVRSHWRKVMEHGSFCGVFFVSGAGNFAKTEKVPFQMRTPEDIPLVVFAAAGVQRDLSRTPFSSKGPVVWDTHHYSDGSVQKPEVCVFNFRLPLMLPDGSVRQEALNGNSFAGPMFCGAIALMLSADPDLLPWDLREIITSTATDVGPEGIDDETGHGLINCLAAVKEVLRRKDARDK